MGIELTIGVKVAIAIGVIAGIACGAYLVAKLKKRNGVRLYKHISYENLGFFGTLTVIAIAIWTLATLAEWVFRLFKSKDPSINGNVTIGDSLILNEVEGVILKKNPVLADKFHDTLTGAGNPKLTFWQTGEMAKEMNILTAKDVSVDEVQGIVRFERSGAIKQY